MSFDVSVKSYVTKKENVVRAARIQYQTGSLYSSYGYHAILVKDLLYIDNDAPDVIKVLSNNNDIVGNNFEEKTISIQTDDIHSNENIPEYGITVHRNYNVQQFNMPIEGCNRILLRTMISFFDIDGTFRTNGVIVNRDTLAKHVKNIDKYGYSAPCVLYADNKIGPLHFQYIPYLYYMMERSVVPVKLFAYYDYKYLESVDEELYKLVNEIPLNPNYRPANYENVLDKLLINYSDKRKVLARYQHPKYLYAPTYSLQNYTRILPFIFSDEYGDRNDDFIRSVLSKKYSSVDHFEGDNFLHSDIPLCVELYWRLCGHMKLTELTTEYVDQIDNMVLKDVIDVDYSMYDLQKIVYYDHSDALTESIKRKIEEYNVDYIVMDKTRYDLFGIEDIDKKVFKKNAKVGVIGL